jgi:TPR repeat protein
MYCTGTGVIRVRWYRRAAEQGDRVAQYNLAVMSLKGQGVQQDAEAAFQWCSAAAEQGLPEAQLQLGDLCGTGAGTPQDRAAALFWYEKASAQGNLAAAARLQALQAAEPGKTPNPTPADRAGMQPGG